MNIGGTFSSINILSSLAISKKLISLFDRKKKEKNLTPSLTSPSSPKIGNIDRIINLYFRRTIVSRNVSTVSDRSGENASFTESWTRMNRANWGEVERERGDDTCVETRPRRVSPSQTSRVVDLHSLSSRLAWNDYAFPTDYPPRRENFSGFTSSCYIKIPEQTRAHRSQRRASLSARRRLIEQFLSTEEDRHFFDRGSLYGIPFRIGPIEEEIWKFDGRPWMEMLWRVVSHFWYFEF